MRARRLSLAVAAAAALAALPGLAPADSSLAALQLGAAPTGVEPSTYDSEYAWAERLAGHADDSPEADARPGERFFLQGAHAFQKGEYEFAVHMYEVSASWAFKPAEYNLAVMYARGQGVAVDLPRAMAWVALAAERDDKRYVDAREAIYAELSKEQFEQANVIWRELKPTYGDEVALRRAKARWAEVKSQMTGSRVGMPGHLEVSTPSAATPDPGRPKGGTPAMEKLMAKTMGARSSVSTPAELTGGKGTDATTAYAQLRASDNPYDPKFDNGALGKATVGPIMPVKDGKKASTDAEPEPEPEPEPKKP